MVDNFLKILELGGSVMLPLIIISIFTVALIIDLIWLNVKTHKNLTLLKNDVLKMEKSYDPISKVVNMDDKSYDDKVKTLNYELHRLERRTVILSTIASIAPLLGLLGTVFGMVRIFSIVSVQKPSNPIATLSGGISEALFATAGGLILAIIAGFAYHFLITSLDSIEEKTKLYFHKLKECDN